MRKIFITLLLLSTILLTNGVAQQISSTAYNKEIIHEDFNAEGNFFPIVTTAENYFILDKGDYFLCRNNKESEYTIIASNSSINNFVLKTAIRIGPSKNKKASIGIIIKTQQDKKGAIIFEINKKREYRIKQLLGDTYKTLSGDSKRGGWVKNKTINGVDKHNAVEIHTENNIYDVYVNNDYLTTFFIPDYTSGSCGIIISPETKARIAYYYINTKGGNEQLAATYTNEDTTNINAPIEELNKKIETLEKNNTTLNNLNTEVRGNQDEKIRNLTQKNTDLADVTIEQEKEIKTLSTTLTNLKSKNTELTNDLNKINKSSNSRLLKFTTEINSLQSDKTTLTTDLTKEKNAHTLTKTRFAESIKNKSGEINELTTELNNVKQQLKSANKTSANLKECSTYSANLSAELKQTNNELSTLRKTQTKHDEVTADLNAKITDLNSTIKALNNQLSNANTKLAALNTTNAELKKLFILKDFEVNGVNPSALTKQTNTYPTPKELKGNSTIYAVQFGVYMQIQPYSALKRLDEVWYETTEHGAYVYLSGQFKSPQEATEHKNSLITLGYPNAFVVTLTK
jgi:uncharacterized coiled-coil DUF342 family protein